MITGLSLFGFSQVFLSSTNLGIAQSPQSIFFDELGRKDLVKEEMAALKQITSQVIRYERLKTEKSAKKSKTSL